MTLSDKMFIIKHKLITKRNIILIIVFSVLLTVIMGCITVINLVINFKYDTFNSEIGRTLVIENINEDTFDEVSNLDYIDYVDSNKYISGGEFLVPEFNTTNIDGSIIDGSIFFKPILNEETLEIIEGQNVKKSGEVICPAKFYPHSTYIDDTTNQKIINSLHLNSKDIIGKSFNVISSNEDYQGKEYEFTIVGTHANKQFDYLNTCYLSKEDYDKISSKYASISGYIDENGIEHQEYNEYNGLMIVVDDVKHIDSVSKQLIEMGYLPQENFIFDTELLNYIAYIPLLLCIIVIIITLNIVYAFLLKKCNYNKKNYGILKSCGYTNKEIINVEKWSTIIVFFISCLISLLIYFIVYFIAQNTILVEFVYNNYTLPIPYLYLILLVAIFLLVFIKFENRIITKILDKDVQYLLER